ncbi:glycosyltransferase [Psychrobacter sp. UBA2769]|uniref:glycosyltransferase n=1 Tax=Psychrobacter sp. UBA2769 TaxID=1947348 RepID=UPI0025DB74F7|nr:glycosyltransferase [Psychrobacter sp. UBA2769]
MKKIYITTHYLKHGGIERMVCNLSNLFIEMNYDVEILCTYYDGEPVYHLNDKVKITYLTYKLPKKTTSLKKNLKELKFIRVINDSFVRFSQYYLHNKVVAESINNIEKSIIISTRNEHTKLINKYSNGSNKLIAQLHCDYSQYKGYLKDIKYRYNNIDYLLLLTEELKNEVEPELNKLNKKTKCLTVPNFIKDKKDKKDKKDIKRKRQIISVGRLSVEKGFDRLLLIWEEFLANNKNYILKIVGDGEEKENLIQLAKSLNISDSIIFTGFLSNDETVKEIRKSKIYVMTSLQEAFPMVLLESISQGIPIVAYDVRVGPRSIIKDGYNGFLVKENDIKTFIEKLSFLLEKNDFYNNMSKNAITSSKLYSEEVIKVLWFEILN